MTYLTDSIAQGIWLSRMTDQAAWGLTDLITAMGPDTRGIEIGVNTGMNSYMLLDACPNITKLIGIDPFEAYMDWRSAVTQPDMDEAYATFRENQELMKSRFELLKLKSTDAAAILEDEAYDFVFIDGDHSIKAVLSDLDLYAPKVKKGGLLAGHDVGLYSVNMAVQGWCRKNQINPKAIHVVENQAWYWVKE
jgi:predicted O-methyltransferase YrrM